MNFFRSTTQLKRSIQKGYIKDYIPHTLTQIGRLNDAIKAEFDLIGLRMSWLVLSESFIFAAFALSVANHKTVGTDKTQGIVQLPEVIAYLVFFLPILGMLMALFVYIAIIAAHSALYRLKFQRDEMMGQLPDDLQIALISRTDWQHKLGNFPPWVMPPTLLLMWVGALCKVLKLL